MGKIRDIVKEIHSQYPDSKDKPWTAIRLLSHYKNVLPSGLVKIIDEEGTALCVYKTTRDFEKAEKICRCHNEGLFGGNCPPPEEKEEKKEEGRKDDAGKLRYDLIPALALKEVVAVLTHGANKYGDENWKKLKDSQRRYMAASMRHGEAVRQGELFDNETGLHHLAHRICSDMFRLQLLMEGINIGGFDIKFSSVGLERAKNALSEEEFNRLFSQNPRPEPQENKIVYYSVPALL